MIDTGERTQVKLPFTVYAVGIAYSNDRTNKTFSASQIVVVPGEVVLTPEEAISRGTLAFDEKWSNWVEGKAGKRSEWRISSSHVSWRVFKDV